MARAHIGRATRARRLGHHLPPLSNSPKRSRMRRPAFRSWALCLPLTRLAHGVMAKQPGDDQQQHASRQQPGRMGVPRSWKRGRLASPSASALALAGFQ